MTIAQCHELFYENRNAETSRWRLSLLAAIAAHAALALGAVDHFESRPTFGMTAGTGEIQVGLVAAAQSEEVLETNLPDEPPAALPVDSDFRTPEPKRKTKHRSAALPEQQSSAGPIGERTPQPRGATRAVADYLANPVPPYPIQSRRLREEGAVLLAVEISASGSVMAIQVIQSSGFTRLDTAALDAVRGWRFKPATFAGIPVGGTVEVPIRFDLK